MIYDNFVRLCASIGKSPSAVALEIGITKSTVSNWKRRKNGPSDVTLEKMAQYFNVPVSHLTGEEKKEKPTAISGDGPIPGYFDLSEENRAKVREYIALLAMSEQKD